MLSGLRQPQTSPDHRNWDRLFLPPGRDFPDLVNIPEAIFPPTTWASSSLPPSFCGQPMGQDARLAPVMQCQTCSEPPDRIVPSLGLSFPISPLCNGIDQDWMENPRKTESPVLKREAILHSCCNAPQCF